MIKKIILITACLGVIIIAAYLMNRSGSHKKASHAERMACQYGPFQLDPALHFYLPAEKTPGAIRLKFFRRHADKRGDRLLIRAFDPEERLIDWEYKEIGPIITNALPGETEIQGMKIKNSPSNETNTVFEKEIVLRKKSNWRDKYTALKERLTFWRDKPAGHAGIYEIRLVAGECNTTVVIESDLPLRGGLCGQNGSLHPWTDAAETYFLYIPRGFSSIKLIQRKEGEIKVEDDQGNAQTFGKGEKVFQVERGDVVWKVKVPAKRQWELRADKPLIFCTDEDTARKIHNSCETAGDGTILAFKSQARLGKLMGKLWCPENVGTADNLIVPLEKMREEWLKDPRRNRFLLGDSSGSSSLGVFS